MKVGIYMGSARRSAAPGERAALLRNARDIAKIIQGDIDLTRRPFREIALKTGRREDEVLDLVRALVEVGAVRRFGAVLRHQRAGYVENVLLLAAVPPPETEDVGRKLASFREVSHCYERSPGFDGYNLFAMVHCRKGEAEKTVKNISPSSFIFSSHLFKNVFLSFSRKR